MAVWSGLAVILFALAAPRVDRPGLYYDEAFMGQQAKDFFEPERGIQHPASTRQTELFGRPFPLRNAVYLGAFKSQLTIPGFALFGTSVRVLRLTTLAWSLLALLCTMLWAERIVGAQAAALGGILVALDPSYLFMSLYEWGPFTNIFLCRAAGFLLLTFGWTARRRAALAAGGLLLGLGVYSRADCAVVVAGAALALALVRPELIVEALQRRRVDLGVALAGAVLGASPMLISLGGLLATSGSPVVSGRGDLAEKLRVLWTLLDGSHFLRLMEAGGRFDRMFEGSAEATLFGAAVVAGLLLAAARTLLRLRRGARLGGEDFLWLTTVFVAAGMLALPGAVRAHHQLNVLPYPHLLLASLAVAGWRARRDRPRRLTPWLWAAVSIVGVAWVAVADLRVSARTFALIEASGGRGRWSDALAHTAQELESEPSARGISLDWGLHEPLLFMTRRARLEEPIWGIRQAVREAGAWRFRGGARDLYLAHDRDYDLFGFGPRFLAAARELARERPELVEIRAHTDLEGKVSYWSVRIAADHELSLQRRFVIRLYEDAPE